MCLHAITNRMHVVLTKSQITRAIYDDSRKLCETDNRGGGTYHRPSMI